MHHVPYMFVYAGQPWLTQKWARIIMDNAYKTGVKGLVGNEEIVVNGLQRVRPGMSVVPQQEVAGQDDRNLARR